MTILNWSGRTWNIAPESYKHPAEYGWRQDILVDENGHLHLDLEKVNGKWLAAMIYSVEPMGHGTYQALIKGLHELDPNAVFGLFPYAWQNQHEQDMLEQAKWRAKTNKAFQFTTQKPAEGGNKVNDVFDLDLPNENDILVTLYWTPTYADFQIEEPATGKILRKWRSNTPVNALLPVPVKMFINLYPCTDFSANPNVGYPPETDQHYVVKSFSYTPIGGTLPSLVTPPIVEPPVVITPVEPPVVVPPAPFVPVPTVLPDVSIEYKTVKVLTSVKGALRSEIKEIWYKRNDGDWKKFSELPIQGSAEGDELTFVAIDSKGNVGPFRTVKL